MSDFDYDSDEFEINIDDPDLVVESSKGYEDLQTPMNIIPTPPKTIDVSAENENNNLQKEEDNVNDTADDESDGTKLLPSPQPSLVDFLENNWSIIVR